MSASIDFLADHGFLLFAGATIALASGLICVLIARQPVHKQRLAEATVIGSLLWLLLAILPLPRRSESPTESAPPVVKPVPIDRTPALRVAPELVGLSPSIEIPKAETFIPIEASPKPAELPREAVKEIRPSPNKAKPVTFKLVMIFTTMAMIAAGLSLVALGVAWVRLQWLVRRSKRPSDELQHMWRRLDPPSRVRLLAGPERSQPLSFGILRPTICVPGSLVERGESTLNAVLRHELAHVRNGDALSRTVFNLAMPILALHPLYWILRTQATFAAELRADAGAAEEVGAEIYVSSLVELFKNGGLPQQRLSASTVWTTESAFLRRMTMLLKRERPIALKSSRRLASGAGLIAVAAAAIFANQFGVVYAQTAKSKTDSTRGAADDATLIFTPTIVETQDGNESTLKTTVSSDGQHAKTKVAQNAPTKTKAENGLSSLLERVVDVERTTASEADGRIWNEIALRIAERKAKLAGLRAMPKDPVRRREILQLEVEIANLEFERQNQNFEQQLATTLNQFQQVSLAATMATDKYGGKHPEIARLQHQLKYLQDQAEGLKATIDERKQQEEVRQQKLIAQAMSEIQEVEGRPLPPPTSSAPSVRGDSDLADHQRRLTSDVAADLQRQLKSAVGQIAKLQAENDTLRKNSQAVEGIPLRSKTVEGTTFAPTLANQSALMETSIPYLKHQLRMAEAEPALLEGRVARTQMDLKRIEKLTSNGVVSQEELGKARAEAEEARAALRKSKIVIESLQTLLKELEQPSAGSKGPFNQPIGVKR